VAAGVGQDSSVAEVFDVVKGQQVAEWVSDNTAPDVFAHRLKDLGLLFNKAYISVEANNHGILTLKELNDLYPTFLIHKRSSRSKDKNARLLQLGVLQSSRVKPLSIGTLRLLLATTWTIHSPLLKDELDSFIEDSDGRLRAEEGCHDDRVMACVAAAYTFEKASLMLAVPRTPAPKKSNNPFLLDNIISELHGRGAKFPIAPQARGIE
jgi:hypothetical protein